MVGVILYNYHYLGVGVNGIVFPSTRVPWLEAGIWEFALYA